MSLLLLALTLGYAVTCIGAGLLGIFTAPVEMRLFYGLDPSAAPGLRANLMGQFAFMKAIELGFGLFAVQRLGPILEGESERRLFTIVIAAGLTARGLAWLQYGRPGPFFLVFLALEAVLLAVLLLEGRLADAG